MDRVLFFLVRLDSEESFALVREKALEDLMVFFLPKLTRLAHCWSVVKVFFSDDISSQNELLRSFAGLAGDF